VRSKIRVESPSRTAPLTQPLAWRPRIIGLWLAVGLAFSPVLVDLAHHLAVEPWARYSLIFPPLLVWCASRERVTPQAARDGFWWLGLAILLELLAVGGGVTRLARPGLPLAAIGICRAYGLVSARTALLALWAIPIPHLVSAFASPGLERTLLGIGVVAANALGGNVDVLGSRALVSGGELAVAPFDGGLPLAAMLSGLGWYASLRCETGLSAAVRRALTWGALAIPIQALAVLIAVGALTVGAGGAGRLFLTHGLWLTVAALGLFWAESLRRQGVGRNGG
jgi:hypothetical protein